LEDTFSRTVTVVGKIHVVTLRGELDMQSAEGLADWLIDSDGSELVVDLSELTFMDTSGITVMVQVRQQLGDSFVLTRPQPNVRRIFEITGLGEWVADWDPRWSAE